MLFDTKKLVLCALCGLLIINSAYAESKQLYSDGAFKLGFSELDNSSELVIAGINPYKSKVFLVNDPHRIVIDILETQVSLDKSFKLSTSKVQGIRTGSHPGKLRVVIDIVGQDLPVYRWRNAGDNLIIQIDDGAPTPVKSVPVKQAKQSRQNIAPKKVASSKVSPTAAALPQPAALPEQKSQSEIHSNLATPNTPASTTTKAQEPPQPPDTALTLKAIGFKHLSFNATSSPVAEVELSKKAQFTIKKSGKNEYTISVPDCLITGQHLLLPYFPPHDFVGITMVRAVREKQALKLLIGTERGVKVTATPRGSSIIIQALSG